MSALPEPGAAPAPVGALPLARPDAPPADPAPRFARPLARALAALDRGLDRVYGSRWNPVDQSGPLAVALMLAVIVSGVYLLLLYRIGAPYESMRHIQGEVAGGRWLRAFHRYASDLAVVMVALHALRMMAQGRTWGPRVLAWVAGLLLVAAMLIVGWTGYVLVWDAHALVLGAAGARLLDSVGLLATPIGRTFGGDATAPASFFFLNLFVHMSLPLGMAALLWIHTLRLARSRWLPDRRLWIVATVALTFVAVLLPAPLGPAADGRALGDRTAYDLFFTAWVPLAQRLPAAGAWAAVVALVLAPLTIPAWWRPAKGARPETSRHNPQACTGCGQCAADCPFEAIAMGANPKGAELHTIAFVNADRCVSCGLCAGSCDQLAIGPPARDGHAQVHAVKRLPSLGAPAGFALVHCGQDGVGERLAARVRDAGHAVTLLEVECAGSLHALTVAQLGARHRGVFVLACPPRRCRSREGAELSRERMLLGHAPALKRPLDATRVRWASGGAADLDELAAEFARFAREAGATAAPGGFVAGARRRRPLERAVAVAVTLGVLALVAWGSQVPAGATPAGGAVRLAWRLPGQSWRDCRPLSAAEIARQPAHMRVTEECRTVYLEYRLRAWVDGAPRVERTVSPHGARGDRPLYVEEDLDLAPGVHRVRVEFAPLRDPRGVGLTLALDDTVRIAPGRARLVSFDADARALRLGP